MVSDVLSGAIEISSAHSLRRFAKSVTPSPSPRKHDIFLAYLNDDWSRALPTIETTSEVSSPTTKALLHRHLPLCSSLF